MLAAQRENPLDVQRRHQHQYQLNKLRTARSKPSPWAGLEINTETPETLQWKKYHKAVLTVAQAIMGPEESKFYASAPAPCPTNFKKEGWNNDEISAKFPVSGVFNAAGSMYYPDVGLQQGPYALQGVGPEIGR